MWQNKNWISGQCIFGLDMMITNKRRDSIGQFVPWKFFDINAKDAQSFSTQQDMNQISYSIWAQQLAKQVCGWGSMYLNNYKINIDTHPTEIVLSKMHGYKANGTKMETVMYVCSPNLWLHFFILNISIIWYHWMT